MRRFVPAMFASLLSLLALWGPALSLPQHSDEAEYIWSGAHYGGMLARLDFSADLGEGTDSYFQPGWAPENWWPASQPMSTRLYYGAVLALTGSQPPPRLYEYGMDFVGDTGLQVPPSTLPVVRFSAVMAAALGLGLIAVRLGWAGLAAVALFLAIPHVRSDLARAWAEGPLLLGFGLATLTWGSRWFTPVCGLAATFKLTALGLWPLTFWHGFGKGRYAHISGLMLAVATWTILTPSSWFAHGPSYLLVMLLTRARNLAFQSGLGIFPTHYLWPAELAALIAVALLAARYWQRR